MIYLSLFDDIHLNRGPIHFEYRLLIGASRLTLFMKVFDNARLADSLAAEHNKVEFGLPLILLVPWQICFLIGYVSWIDSTLRRWVCLALMCPAFLICPLLDCKTSISCWYLAMFARWVHELFVVSLVGLAPFGTWAINVDLQYSWTDIRSRIQILSHLIYLLLGK